MLNVVTLRILPPLKDDGFLRRERRAQNVDPFKRAFALLARADK
jgi:hypothetical protein